MHLSLNGHVLPDTTNIENDIMPPPPDGQWARPRTVDGSIGRFLLPIGGALLRLHFHINCHALTNTTNDKNGTMMPPPATALTGTGTSGGIFALPLSPQKLRASLSSNRVCAS